jgi:hypothetical protein
MLVRMLPPIMVAIIGICLSDEALAVDGGRHHTPIWSRSANTIGWKKAARTRALASNPYADPAAPYKANRLSSSRQRINDRRHKAGHGRQERHDRQGCFANDPGRHGRTIILARKQPNACKR